MKTNQIMVRDNSFIQRTKDGYFNATILLESYNIRKSGNKLQMPKFKQTLSTKKFIEQLKKEGIEKPMITGRGSGKNGGTWMHPKLFIDFAMWVSVEFKSKVIDYVLDGLIFNRNEAGDYYKEMCATIMDTYVSYYGCKPNPMIYSHEAKMIRQMAGVGNKDRNEMTEQELGLITILQKYNSVLLRKKIGKVSRIKQLQVFSEVGVI